MADSTDPKGPWVPRAAGDLLSSAAWNDMQRMAKADIAAVGTRVEAVESALAAGLRRVEVVTGQMARTSGYTENQLGTYQNQDYSATSYYGPGVFLGRSSNHSSYSSGDSFYGYWDFLSSPVLQLRLSSRSLVLMTARGLLAPNSGNNSSNHYLCLQFVLGQSGSRAPVRFNPNNLASAWGLSYSVKYLPNADNWTTSWLPEHHTFYNENSKRWPCAGPIFTGFGSNTSYLPLALEESADLPPGDFSLQMGFSTNASQYSSSGWNLYGLTLSATIIPV